MDDEEPLQVALAASVALRLQFNRFGTLSGMKVHGQSIADEETTVLYRPVGTTELGLILESGSASFPPRLPEQPIFYPVTNEGYAMQIARDWNARHNEDKKGYVTRFRVRTAYLNRFELRVVGGAEHEEYWIPAEDLEEFNRQIVGAIEVVARFDGTAA